MLAVIAKDVVLSRGEELKLWKEVTFWVDKVGGASVGGLIQELGAEGMWRM